MDRKTLEYMEERAKNARYLVNKINKLSENAKKAEHADKVIFWGYKHNVNVEEDSELLVNGVAKIYIELIVAEIQRLEKELAEL